MSIYQIRGERERKKKKCIYTSREKEKLGREFRIVF